LRDRHAPVALLVVRADHDAAVTKMLALEALADHDARTAGEMVR